MQQIHAPPSSPSAVGASDTGTQAGVHGVGGPRAGRRSVQSTSASLEAPPSHGGGVPPSRTDPGTAGAQHFVRGPRRGLRGRPLASYSRCWQVASSMAPAHHTTGCKILAHAARGHKLGQRVGVPGRGAWRVGARTVVVQNDGVDERAGSGAAVQGAVPRPHTVSSW
ncbi:hypothetical protein GWK47_026006 [Chionoecetes opilio]|uniref:Uncharacterized protein n=1 Tax=Chionoecetes opilio TaxID=41210 RepID=A0A8J8WEV5_CHIOP|nr:hypothetical protein GWK47_026006 [Chionoecetes opilio]